MNPEFRPVKISKGALGENAPSSDLKVSPQHRIPITEARAEIMFGDADVQALFPDLAAKGCEKPTRPMLKAYEARALVSSA